VLSGDLHGFYAAQLFADFDAPGEALAVEYATSAISAPAVDVQLARVISSDPFLDALGLGRLVPDFDANLLAANPHLKHSVSSKNGLAIVELGAGELKVRFLESSSVELPLGAVTREVAFRTPVGTKAIEPL
jgi:hypothetical protein